MVEPHQLNSMLAGRVAVVTGATRGIGYATAYRMLACGARVAICGRNKARLDEAQAALASAGGEVFAYQADILDAEAVDGFIAEVGARFGKIDILVNNAGESNQRTLDGVSWPVNSVDSVGQPLPKGRFETISDDEYRIAFEQKFLGLARVTRTSLPWLRKSGDASVINITSIKGKQPPPRTVISGIAWSAVMNLSKSLSIELAEDNIRVNVVSVGGIMTPHMEESRARFAPDSTLTEFLAPRVANIPLKRLGTSEEVAQAILFLSSPMSAYITGQVLALDGGGLRSI